MSSLFFLCLLVSGQSSPGLENFKSFTKRESAFYYDSKERIKVGARARKAKPKASCQKRLFVYQCFYLSPTLLQKSTEQTQLSRSELEICCVLTASFTPLELNCFSLFLFFSLFLSTQNTTKHAEVNSPQFEFLFSIFHQLFLTLLSIITKTQNKQTNQT